MDAGLYDGYGKLVYSWKELEIDYGLNVEKDYEPRYLSGYNTLFKNMYLKNNFQYGNTLVIPNGIRKIGNFALAKCNSLEKIILPDSIETIGECAFTNCATLREINIPYFVKGIGESAFEECRALEKIVIVGSIKELPNRLFYNCKNLGSFGENPRYFNAEMNRLVFQRR